MAGYVFLLNSPEKLRMYTLCGVYSTVLKIRPNRRNWVVFEGTFADYALMKPGDNVYFFHNRLIYGIGRMVELNGGGLCDCRFENFPGASTPQYFDQTEVEPYLLWREDDLDENATQRWICCFEPDPAFFRNGIDMDEVLNSNPHAFRMLRALQDVSFIKLDDEENQALKEVILRHNLNNNQCFPWDNGETHRQIERMLNDAYALDVQSILRRRFNRTGSFSHEYALEAYIALALRDRHRDVVELFGEWDYLSRQVVASPFKPIRYMDRMDLFGYSFISGYEPLRQNYLLIELKKGRATESDIDQAMKYVDWIRSEYTRGDYEPIRAFLVCRRVPESVREYCARVRTRYYTVGTRPVRTQIWENLRLIEYTAQEIAGAIVVNFIPVEL